MAMNEPSGGDVLTLNVGGTKMTVLRRTLTQLDGSMLASMFSGRWDEALSKDKDGFFFIDQPVDLFQPMINHLRALALLCPCVGLPMSPTFTAENAVMMEQHFCRMVEHYGVSELFYPIGVYEEGSTEMLADAYSKNCINTGGSHKSYILKTPFYGKGRKPLHCRDVMSFEVTFGENTTRARIGWRYDVDDDFYSNRMTRFPAGKFGVMRICRMMRDDEWPKCCILNMEESETTVIWGTATADFLAMTLPLVKGTTIRCNVIDCRWSVNGRPLRISGFHRSFGHCPAIPCVSINGEFTITPVELQPL